MTKKLDKKTRQKARKGRTTNPIVGSAERPRVVFSQSNRHLRVQAIDDKHGHTIIAYSTENFTEENNHSYKNKIYAQKLAEIFADKLKKEGKENIVFDRNGHLYHGKIEVFCETMRQLGINF